MEKYLLAAVAVLGFGQWVKNYLPKKWMIAAISAVMAGVFFFIPAGIQDGLITLAITQLGWDVVLQNALNIKLKKPEVK